MELPFLSLCFLNVFWLIKYLQSLCAVVQLNIFPVFIYAISALFIDPPPYHNCKWHFWNKSECMSILQLTSRSAIHLHISELALNYLIRLLIVPQQQQSQWHGSYYRQATTHLLPAYEGFVTQIELFSHLTTERLSSEECYRD